MKRRIFVGLIEVAGYFARLTRALRGIGEQADYFGIFDAPTYRTVDVPRAVSRLRRYARHDNVVAGPMRSRLSVLVWRFALKVRIIVLFLKAALRYDVFIFSAGVSFFSGLELWLLRSLGKRIIFVYLGSESRPPYLNGIFLSKPQWKGYWYLKRYSKRIARRVRFHERVAHAIVSHRAASQFLRRPFFDYLSIGYPIEPPQYDGAGVARNERRVVVHAPSLPAIKGTARIRQIVETVGGLHGINYVELVGRTNAEVLEQLSSCDLVVDEVYSDTILGGLGAEAASFGKPTLVSGYAQAEQVCPFESRTGWPPAEYCSPQDLESRFAQLLEDTAYRQRLGQAARHFVSEYWAPENVARRMVRIIEGSGSPAWIVRISDITYYLGYGIEEDVLREKLETYLCRFGTRALMLGHNPSLKDAIVEFAGAKRVRERPRKSTSA